MRVGTLISISVSVCLLAGPRPAAAGGGWHIVGGGYGAVGLRAAVPPTNSAVPSISGNPWNGQTLTADPGSWTNSPSSFSYQWERCDVSGGSCTPVSAATASTYALGPADVGTTVRVLVGATSAGGTSSPVESAQSQVIGDPPQNLTMPTISGTTAVGQTLTAIGDSWSGTPTPTLTYYWGRCNSSNTCITFPGNNQPTYTIRSDDVGTQINVSIVAANFAGSALGWSGNSATVVSLPVDSVRPWITGTAKAGATLTVNPGSWTQSPTSYSYQWERCDASGAGCASYDGHTSNTLVTVTGDLGSTFRVLVTATNAAGTTAAVESAATNPIVTGVPVNTVLPYLTGTTVGGEQLFPNMGSWTQYPVSYIYGWQRCDSSGANCSALVGAPNSGLPYTLQSGDVGHTFRLNTIRATNGWGTSAGFLTGPVTAVITSVPTKPTNLTPPVITGSTVGQTLTATNGSWTQNPTSYSYQWWRCDSNGANCASMTGQTTAGYTALASDQGSRLKIAVWATNATGTSGPVYSALTSPIGTVPVNITAPSISGTWVLGFTLTADPGSWSGYPIPSYSYQWNRCDMDGNNCVPIAGATASIYWMTLDDYFSTVNVTVTATNTSGSASASSPSGGNVQDPPANIDPPTIGGTLTSGQALSATTGTWSGSQLVYGYQWNRCDTHGANCTPIGGQTAASYTLTDADTGFSISVTVSASNYAGTATADSASVGLIGGGELGGAAPVPPAPSPDTPAPAG